MTWPFENDTSFIEKKIASRSFLRDRMRNLFVVTAIILTTVLFTGLFTLGAGITASTQRANYILSGGDGHARIIDMNDSEYATISSHPLIREIAYCRKLADSVDNGQLSKRETLFWYYDDVGMKYQFIEPTVGHKPVAENEVIADTTTLELLGVPEKVGAELSLELTIHGQKVTRNFILSGWWNSYPGVQYGTIVTSRAYMDAHEDELVNTFSQDHNDTGTITGIIKFENTKNVERDLATVIADSGYSSDTEAPNYINAGVNPLYLSSEKSTGTGTILALICILAAFLLTGYLIIYNIFQISVLRDLHFYGLLKTIGTTDRQIRSILSRQAWILSLIGIPIGLGGGFFIGKALLPLLIEQTSFSAAYATVSPNPLIFVAAALFALLTVKISIRKPVKMAAKVSPIEALRYTDSDTAMKGKRKKRIRSGNLQKRMAWENLGRDKKRTILVILSLSLSIILTNTVFNFSNSVDPENAIQNMINFDFCIGQSSLLDYYRVSEESALSQSFIQAVEQQDGFDYGGCEYVDVVETLAIERAKKLFGCEYANVQPHSGAQANLAAFFAMVEPGDTVMGMSLDCGGHLSHGSPVNISGKYFNIVPYGVTAEGFIDYDEVLRIAKECKPKMIIAGASAYARVIDFKKFREIADEVGAYLMVDMAHIAGLVAGGEHPSPIPYADVVTTTTHKTLRGPRGGMILSSAEAAEKFKFNKAVFPGIQGGPLMHVIAGKAVCLKEALDPSFKTYAKNIVDNAQALCTGLMNRGFDIVSGGTDNHLMLVNLLSKNKTGKEVEKLLDAANITCNKNTIPNDPASPFVTSGIRLGTAAVTTRGFNTADMDVVAEAIALLVDDVDANQAKAMAMVKELTDKYPLYE